MSREKQIEEIYEVLTRDCDTSCIECKFDRLDLCVPHHKAEALYEAGYRKQSEGCDFCKEGNEKCGTCVKFFDYHEDGGSDRCSIEYGNEKCAYYKPVHHCSNCGAKMKGGESNG